MHKKTSILILSLFVMLSFSTSFAKADFKRWMDEMWYCPPLCGDTFRYSKKVYETSSDDSSLKVEHLFCAENPIYEDINIQSLPSNRYSGHYYKVNPFRNYSQIQLADYRHIYCLNPENKKRPSGICSLHCGENYSIAYEGTYHSNPIYVCVFYPLACGLDCTEDWIVERSPENYNYYCLEAIQNVEQKRVSPTVLADAVNKAKKAMPKGYSCSQLCGKGFFYHKTQDKAKTRICLKNSSQDTSSRAIRWKGWKGIFNDKKFICKEATYLDKK